MSPDEETLEYLYTMYYAALNAVTKATWITAYPPPLPSEESEALKQARSMANEYDQRIRRRLQQIKDSVSTPLTPPTAP